jgi:hypothetical protein
MADRSFQDSSVCRVRDMDVDQAAREREAQ